MKNRLPALAKLITSIFVVAISFQISINFIYAATNWQENPNSCPSSDETNFPGQSCPGSLLVCGDNSGTAQCYDMSTMVAPGSNSAASNTQYNSLTHGGYVVDCYAIVDSGSPFCDNSGVFWCNRDPQCVSWHRNTICQASKFAYQDDSYECAGSCHDGYHDCNNDSQNCEIHDGDSCGISSHGDYLNCSGGLGNCTCRYDSSSGTGTSGSSSNYFDCDSSGADTGNGCESQYHGTSSCGGHAWITHCSGGNGVCSCQSGNIDFDNNDSDDDINTGGSGNGCEIITGEACTMTVGGLAGTCAGTNNSTTGTANSDNDPCECVGEKSYFETGTQSSYSTSSPLLWGTQFGTGDLIHFGNGTNADLFVVNNDGSISVAQITAPTVTTDKLYNVSGSLYWNGTLIGAASGGSSIWDDDSDTGIQVEENTDEDIIRFDTDGIERLVIDGYNTYLGTQGENYLNIVSDGISGDPGYLQFMEVNHTILKQVGSSGDTSDLDITTFNNTGIAFMTNGTQAMRIGTNQHVSIGATNTTLATLYVSNGDQMFTADGDVSLAMSHDGADIFFETWSTDAAEGLIMHGGGSGDAGIIKNIGGSGYTSGWVNTALHIFTTAAEPILLRTNDTERIEIAGTGAIQFNNAYTFPTTDGTNNQVLTTNGSGAISWAAGGSGNVEDGAVAGQMVFWDGTSEYKHTETNELFWDDTSKRLGVGTASPAVTLHVTNNSGTNPHQVMRIANTNSASYFDLVSIDENPTAGYQAPLGSLAVVYNKLWIKTGVDESAWTEVASGGSSSWVQGGNMFSQGGMIGTNDDHVLGIRTNGVTRINIANSAGNGAINFNSAYTFPTADGSSGRVLQTDGNGTLSWEAVSGGAFSTTSNVTSNTPGTLATDDFVFGSDQLADDGDTDHDYRMFFDKSEGSFRAGMVDSTQWDSINVGSISMAFGWNAEASGNYATALGRSIDASGISSVALGYSSTASGNYSTALGIGTLASHQYSTAFGRNTTASAEHATVMGYGTTASGDSSTAMGFDSTALGDYSTALGYDTIASGTISTAIGQDSHAAGSYSFTGGRNMRATSGNATFIWGYSDTGQTFAPANNRFLIFPQGDAGRVGIGTATPRTLLELSGDGAILATGTDGSGWIEPNLGAGTRLLWYPRESSFRAGGVTGTQWNEDNIGNYSIAMGYNTTASAFTSIALGWGADSSGAHAVALGGDTTASNEYALATGRETTASGQGSTALGWSTTASGNASTSMGYQTTASGTVTTAIGRAITAGTNPDIIAIGLDDTPRTCNQSNSLCIMGGDVGIETNSPGYRLQVGETSNYGWVAADGSWGSSSDVRFKENITSIDNALEMVSQMDGIRYNVIDDSQIQVGFSAQDLEKILPEVVSTDANGYKGVVYAKLAPVLVNAIQELKIEKDEEVETNIFSIDQLGELVTNQQVEIDSLGDQELITETLKYQLAEEIWQKIEENHLDNLEFADSELREELSLLAEWNNSIWKFIEEVIFEKTVSFLAEVVFGEKVIFEDRVTFADQDMAGFAIIKSGVAEVEVKFEKGFEQEPVIVVTAKNANLEYGVKDESVQKFIIYLNQVATQDEKFAWTALSIKNAKTFESEMKEPVSTTSSDASPIISPTPDPTPEASLSTSPTPSPEPSLEPTPTHLSEPTPQPITTP